MQLCSNCKKRPAIVFAQYIENGERVNKGYCLTCAKQLNIPQINDFFEQHHLDTDAINAISDEMMEIFNGEEEEPNEDADNMPSGGSPAMPNFMRSLFQSSGTSGVKQPSNSSSSDDSKKEKRAPSKKKSKNEEEFKFLSNYCVDLSARAEKGELDAIIGRDRELSRVMQILSRRSKNNPCLIGEPGVGKTAIAEGLAQRIVAGECPAHLRDRKIYLLDLTGLVAGTQYRGQFEQRVKGLINDVVKAGNVILFIDEVHNLVGAGDSEGSVNAANILKPALSRGEIQVIGATTFKEYRKYIEKDSALERRFQPVTVTEPNVE